MLLHGHLLTTVRHISQWPSSCQHKQGLSQILVLCWVSNDKLTLEPADEDDTLRSIQRRKANTCASLNRTQATTADQKHCFMLSCRYYTTGQYCSTDYMAHREPANQPILLFSWVTITVYIVSGRPPDKQLLNDQLHLSSLALTKGEAIYYCWVVCSTNHTHRGEGLSDHFSNYTTSH